MKIRYADPLLLTTREGHAPDGSDTKLREPSQGGPEKVTLNNENT